MNIISFIRRDFVKCFPILLLLFFFSCATEDMQVPEIVGTCDAEEVAAVSEDEVREFLSAFQRRLSNGELLLLDRVIRWGSAPVMRIADSSTDAERRTVEDAVSRINYILPDHFDIQIAEDIESGIPFVPDGEIYVEFAERSAWISTEGNHFDVETPLGLAFRRLTESEIRAARIWVLPESGNCELLHTFTHELLHVLGFRGHPPNSYVGQSIMPSPYPCRTEPVEAIPGVLDCALLGFMYTD